MEMPLVSVCMTTYNHEPYIAEAIESVLAQQTSFGVELVVGEDCSTDRTAAICREYAAKYPDRIRLVTSPENVGWRANYRRTFEACRGKYVAYLDGDDWWCDPRKLQMQADLMESDPGCGMCYTRASNYWQASDRTEPDHPDHYTDFGRLLCSLTIANCATLARRELIARYYDEVRPAEHPDEAAEIVFKYGSSVSADHQKYMASEVAKLVTTDTKGNAVSASDVGKMDEDAMQQTLDLAKQYIKLDDATAADKLAKLTLDDIRSSDYLTYDGGAVEKSDLKVQLKWLPQAQFMGYYVALDKGYYKDNGLNVEIVSGGGDVSETVAVSNGTVDFGVTWVSNLINANAGGMELLEVAQVYQRSGLVLCYKKSQFTK